MSIISKYRELLAKLKPQVRQAVSYFNPTSNQGQNFWSSEGAKKLVNVKSAIDKIMPTIGSRYKEYKNSQFGQSNLIGLGQVNLKPVMVKIGQSLKKFPATTIEFKPQYKPVGLNTGYAPINLTKFVTSIPGEQIRSYGQTLEKIGTGNKLGFWDYANISDFIPGLGFVGGGVKPVSREIGEKLIREGGKNILKKESIKNFSLVKNLADNSGTVTEFVRKLTKNPKFANTIRQAGFEKASDFWKYTHEGFKKVENLMNESLAQSAFRRKTERASAKAIPVEEFEKQMTRLNISVKEKVGIHDFFRTPDNVLKKIGMEDQAKFLRQQWDAYQAQLPKEIEKIRNWASQVTPQGNQKIFKYLDGQINSSLLDQKELKVANEIKSYLKGWADKLKLPKDARISNYITHIFKNDIVGKEFPQEVAEIIRKGNIPGQTYDPFLMKRYGFGGYIEDTWRALSAYVKRATRAYNIDPALQNIKKVSKELEESQYDYLKNYIEGVQMRPKKLETSIDNTIKQLIGYRFGQRPTNIISQKLRQYTYRGLLGLNPGSALKNLTQASNTYAELGEKYTLKGYAKVTQNLKSLLSGTDNELYRVGVLRDEFIQDKTLPVFKNALQKLDSGLFYMFELAEKINRGAAYWGAKSKYLNQGLDEIQAIEKAKEVVRKTQFSFGRIDTPLVLQSDIAKTIGQFQTYTLKQIEFLGEKVVNKEWAGLLRYTGATLVMALTVGKAFGWEPKDLFPSLRFGTPPSLQFPWEAGKALLNAPDKYGQERTITEKISDVGKSFVPYIPAGGQLKKSIQGIQSYQQGASLTPTGRTRFEIEKTTPNLIKSVLFGQYATPEGRQYVKNLGKTKGEIIYNEIKNLSPQEKATRAKQLKQSDPDAYKSLVKFMEDKRMKISTKEKNIRSLPIKDGSRTRAIIKLLNGKTPEEKANILKRLKELKVITDEVYKQIIAAKKAGAIK